MNQEIWDLVSTDTVPHVMNDFGMIHYGSEVMFFCYD